MDAVAHVLLERGILVGERTLFGGSTGWMYVDKKT